jgi:hypothetical protein
MDYIHRLHRQSELYEKKKKLELISHSQLQPSATGTGPGIGIPKKAMVVAGDAKASEVKAKAERRTGLDQQKEFDADRWRQEIKEKRMRAELKGFHSVGTSH